MFRKNIDVLAQGKMNSASIFIKRSYDLLKPNGYFGFIIPKSFLYVESWEPTRNFILNNTQLTNIVDVSKAFADVKLEQVIITYQKRDPTLDTKINLQSINHLGEILENKSSQKEILESGVFIFDKSIIDYEFYRKIKNNTIPLSNISKNFRGIGAQKHIVNEANKESNYIQILGGKQIGRYSINGVYGYVDQKLLSCDYANKLESFKEERILAQNIVAHIKDHIKIMCTYDNTNLVVLDTINNIVINSKEYKTKYILSLLNSKLISFYAYFFIYSRAIRTMHFDGEYTGKIPIKMIPVERQLQFEKLVDEQLLLNKKLIDYESKKSKKVESIQRKNRQNQYAN